MTPNRRDVLLGSSAVLASQAFGGPRRAAAADLQVQPSLRELGEKAGIPYGLCEPASRFPKNRPYMERLAKECSLLVPGNEFNWKLTQPSKNSWNFAALDRVADFCRKNDLGLVGHTLMWYYFVPKWVSELDGPSAILDAIDGFISHAVGRYKGVAVRWDVVNEQIEPKDGREDGLRKSFWIDKLGPDYMKFAFASARKADPNVSLCFNEYGFEYSDAKSLAKREALLKLLRKMRDDKVEVDCVGFQSHLDGSAEIDFDGLQSFTRSVVELGYKVALTELDVRDTALPADPEKRDAIAADRVRSYLDCVMAEVKPTTITSWGFTDDTSWYQFFSWSRRSDKQQLRPLPFDANFRRKPQWGVIAEALNKAAR